MGAWRYVVLEMTPVSNIDATAVHMIQDLFSDFRTRHVEVALTTLSTRVAKVPAAPRQNMR